MAMASNRRADRAAAATALAEGPGIRPIPRATYRLQFNREFGFDRAASLAPYLAALGVSHVYSSPYLRARPGSAHGYDIISHNGLNPDLGDAASFDRMVEAFRHNGLRQVLDFVPNHMGVGGADNPWWLDVLEWGRASVFSGWFDIDWEPDQRYLFGKLLVPILGEQYGTALGSGALAPKFDSEVGAFAVWAYDKHKLPICPLSYESILGDGHPELERLGDAFANLSARDHQVASRAKLLQTTLAEVVRADLDIARALVRAFDRFTGVVGDLESWSRLDGLIRSQHWRVAHFRVAADDINYRRFFDVNDLACIRMELPEVFDHAHALIFRLLREGAIDGLRIDHIDGLYDPKHYCLQLRQKAPRPFYLVVEKILARHEDLREDWGIDGATGYEVANLIAGLLTDPAGEEPLTRLYSDFTGNRETFGDIVRDSKRGIMDNELASELNSLARDAASVARSNSRTADFTQNILHRALKEIIAAFPVYRTYIDESAAPTAADRRDLEWALAKARRHDNTIDASVFDFLHAMLSCDLIATPKNGFSRAAVIRVAMRTQQYTGPVMAKGMEDTAFYRYARMFALNEVGGHPSEFHVTVAAFHHANQRRAQRFPHAMLSTSTHDTKRGEDARGRLAVLSEHSLEWTQHVIAWNRILRAGEAGSQQRLPPDRNDEYAFYQLLLGSWPPELSAQNLDPGRMEVFRLRLEGAMTKAMREAKVNTSWAAPNLVYEDAVLTFIRSALDTTRKNSFLASFLSFQESIATAGMGNSLIQSVLKFTLPGVPDIYQGAELWDFSFVDPDNRRPVDYDIRSEMLSDMRREAQRLSENYLSALATNWRDGQIKLFLAFELLKLRQRQPRIFQEGSYEPLAVSGAGADRICAFARNAQDETIVVAALLYPGRSSQEDIGATKLSTPPAIKARSWVELFSRRQIEVSDDSFAARELFALLPVAVLTPNNGSS
jgi:(1->4)-alpha-D-glucan 1-alpha-D-glucosylmutase